MCYVCVSLLPSPCPFSPPVSAESMDREEEDRSAPGWAPAAPLADWVVLGREERGERKEEEGGGEGGYLAAD